MKDKTQLYIYPASYAREHGELEQYRASYKANIACKEAIEQAIADHYRNVYFVVDRSRTYTNKTERAGTVKNFQIRTKQILSLLLRAVQKTIISKFAQNHCIFSCFAL